jgi:hypothetical protein
MVISCVGVNRFPRERFWMPFTDLPVPEPSKESANDVALVWDAVKEAFVSHW